LTGLAAGETTSHARSHASIADRPQRLRTRPTRMRAGRRDIELAALPANLAASSATATGSIADAPGFAACRSNSPSEPADVAAHLTRFTLPGRLRLRVRPLSVRTVRLGCTRVRVGASSAESAAHVTSRAGEKSIRFAFGPWWFRCRKDRLRKVVSSGTPADRHLLLTRI
jgi:hypothetical protein